MGFDTSDDAGVYQISTDTALVQTVDFFTPIVDDPYTYGAIAAANSLSDVYAMGGRPISALSILAYPAQGDLEDLEQIVRGGADKIVEAECALIGGHSISDEEVKFGYAVTGLVHPDRVLRNGGARAGDVLVLTKAIGTGVIATALKREIASGAHVDASIQSMLRLNRDAAAALEGLPVHACTDVTGFGFLGHLREMVLASGVTAIVEAGAVPLLDGALEYARAGAIPGGLKNNRAFAGGVVDEGADLEEALVHLLYDPQTSGGLLVALPEMDARVLCGRLSGAVVIGRFEPLQEKAIRLR